MDHSTILITIATAFNHLKDDVHSALLTQLGDVAQLDQRIRACSRLSMQINQVSHDIAFAAEQVNINKNSAC
jgi:hypothetical protein